MTCLSDWCICFSLLDPSVLDSFGGVLYTSSPGIKINCFMRVEQWLPNPKQGDVILLRQVKVPRTTIHLGSGLTEDTPDSALER